jgi:dienelactone hydrolase
MATHDSNVDIVVDGDRLAGTFVHPEGRRPGVLFVHGWGGSQAQYLARARAVAALGCVCLTFDLTGHVATHTQLATVSRERNLQDVAAAYDRLAADPQVDASAIAVVGSSYGGYLGAILSSFKRVRWLALRVPALYRDAGWDIPKLELHRVHDLLKYRQQVVPPQKNRALLACTKFEGDVLLVESEFDHLIPHAVITSYRGACVEARSLTYRVMKGADHGLSDEREQAKYTDMLVHWLSEMFAERGAALPKPRAEPASATDQPETPPEST